MPSFPSAHDSATQTSSLSPRSNSSPIPSAPSNIDIDAVIQAATSSSNAQSPARDTRTQLYVGNLPYRVRWQDLKDLFRKAGTVLRADVSLGPDNRSRGYGTVLLASAEDAAKAIDMYNGYSWQMRILEVRADRLPPDMDLSNPMNTLTFPKSHSSNMHPVPFIPPINGAYVQYQDPALSMLQAKMTESQSNSGLSVPSPIGTLSTPTSPPPGVSASSQGRNLFVGNLPFHCQWQDLKDLFRSAGQIVRADVALGADGRSRGFGTVLFANDADANTAVAMFNGYEYNGRTLKVHHDRFTQLESPQPSLPNYHHSVSGSPPDNSPPPMLSIHQPPAPSFSQPTMPQSPYFRLAPQPGSPFHQFLPLSTGSQGVMGFTQTPGQHPLHAQRNHQYLHEASAPTLQIPSIRPTTGSHNAVPGEISGAKGSEHPPPVAPSAPSSNTMGTASTAPGAERLTPLQNASQSTAATKPSTSSTGRAPPGTLSLPSQAFSVSNPLSPHLTRGLPPMTPSMPGFTFHAPPVSTPPVAPHFLSPGLGPFSPPMTFFNPYLNPAPGAPLRQQSSTMHSTFNGTAHQPFGMPTPQPRLSPRYINGPGSPHGTDSNDYFPPVLSGSEPKDYFAGAVDTASPSQGGRGSVTTSSRSERTLLSSGDSSPQNTGDTRLSSRGTSILAESEEILNPTLMGISNGERSYTLTVGEVSRAKSSSPADADTPHVPEAVKRTSAAQSLSNGSAQRRASWTDIGSLRRAVADITLGNRNLETDA